MENQLIALQACSQQNDSILISYLYYVQFNRLSRMRINKIKNEFLISLRAILIKDSVFNIKSRIWLIYLKHNYKQ